MSRPDKVLREDLGRSVLVLRGEHFNVFQKLAFLALEFLLLPLDSADGSIDHALVLSGHLFGVHFRCFVSHNYN